MKAHAVVLLLATLNVISCGSSSEPKYDYVSKEQQESREQILADLKTDDPKLHVRVLTSLPDAELPELQSHFAKRAAGHPWLFGSLLARYGTARVIAPVRSTYDAGHLRWACDSRFPFLAYFLRVHPIEGEAMLRAALKERKNNGCFRSMLSSVGRLYAASELEAVAIDALNDPDLQVAQNASLTLALHGSTRAEGHLWVRLGRWVTERRHRSINGSSAGDEGEAFLQLGHSLQGAIITAQGWYFDESRRCRLYALCGADHCRDQFATPSASSTPVRIRVHQLMYGQPSFEVGWYNPDTLHRFRYKVSQFPAGTIFGWCTDREGGGMLTRRQTELAKENVKGIVEAGGFTFVDNPPFGSCSMESGPPA